MASSRAGRLARSGWSCPSGPRSFFTSSCAISTCGSFWKTAATVTTGTPPSRICIICRSLEPITQSAWPAAMHLHDVDLRAAHLDGHVQAVLLVDAGGHRLVEAAVLGLRVPVGHVGELLLRVGGAGGAAPSRRRRRTVRRGGVRSVSWQDPPVRVVEDGGQGCASARRAASAGAVLDMARAGARGPRWARRARPSAARAVR